MLSFIQYESSEELKCDPCSQARDLVRRSSGVERTRELARAHADKAREVLSVLPESEAKGALEVLTEKVVKRTS